jgi:hypothetical protein
MFGRLKDLRRVATRYDRCPTVFLSAIALAGLAEAELFRRWWVPEGHGVTLVACEMDVRTGGEYPFEFGAGDADTMAFDGSIWRVSRTSVSSGRMTKG